MAINTKIGVSGLFKSVEVLRAGKVVRKTGEFTNLITDVGLARLASPGTGQNSCFNYIRVGTGNAPPSPSDLALQDQIASTNVDSNYEGSGGVNLEEGFVWRRVTWTFEEGAVVGNVSELATGWDASSSGTIFSRALVRDSEGNPTTITVLADEQLRVTWEHRRYWATEDVSGTLVNEGNKGGVYNYRVRAADVGNWTIGRPANSGINISSLVGAGLTSRNVTYNYPSELGPIDGFPTGSPSSYSGSTGGGVAGPSSVSRNIQFSLTQANSSAGISCLVFQSYDGGTGTRTRHAFQVEFDPPLIKTSEDVMEIGVQINWARA